MTMRSPCLALSLLLVATPALAHPSARLAGLPAAQPGRLPVTATPLSYRVHLRPDLARRSFTGDVTATFRVDRPTPGFVLHANDLVTSQVRLDGRIPAAAVIPHPADQTLTVRFAKPVAAGTHSLSLHFTGAINDLPRGMFAMEYQDRGIKKVMLSTEHEPADARRLFPLWDEPSSRARFSLSVDLPKGQSAYSNMPESGRTAAPGGRTRISFRETPPMPSYLLVLAAGDLERRSRRVGAVDVGVVTTRGKSAKGAYALQVTAELLPWYNTYFGTPYPLPKLDLIATPGGFGGAMENWGGITFFEPRLLYDPATAGQSDKEDIYHIIAHEVAHQWFGNLVTMKWWDDLWLNEGFASWMEVKATDDLHPEWKVWLGERESKDRTLAEDARTTTHPIQAPVVDPTDAEAAFDGITYGKGMALIRMLEGYLGEDRFRAGIQLYMKRHAYGNTATTDLWSALEDASRQPIRRIASEWTTRPGYPLLTVTTRCEGDRGTVTLSQKRFMATGEDLAAAPWPVPVVLGVGAKREAHLLDQPSATWPLPACDQPLVANAGDAGFYRVAYDATALARMRSGWAQLAPADRAAILSDTWAVVAAQGLPASAWLGLADAVPVDDDPAVWTQVLGALGAIYDYQREATGKPAFAAAVRRRLAPLTARLGWTPRAGEPSSVTKLRPAVLAAMGRSGDPAVLAEARKRFAAWQKRPASLSADLRPVVLGLVGRTGGVKPFEVLLAKARAAEDVKDQRALYYALAGTLDTKLAGRALAETLRPGLDTSFQVRLMRQVGYEHPTLARAFLQRESAKLLGARPPQDRAEALTAAYKGFMDAAAADELEAYGKRTLPAAAWQELRKEATRIREDAAVRARLVPAFDAWAQK